MPGGRRKKNAKRPGVIEMVQCEHCDGSGRRAKIVDDVIVRDALASLQRIAAKVGPLAVGGIDAEVCLLGVDMTIDDLSSGTECPPIDGSGLARDLEISAWELAADGTMTWRTGWDLESMLRNRVRIATGPRRDPAPAT